MNRGKIRNQGSRLPPDFSLLKARNICFVLEKSFTSFPSPVRAVSAPVVMLRLRLCSAHLGKICLLGLLVSISAVLTLTLRVPPLQPSWIPQPPSTSCCCGANRAPLLTQHSVFERKKCLLDPSGKQNSSSPIPALNELCAGPGSPARSLGFIYHTRAWEGGKKSNQTARGELLFLLGAGSPLSHCLSLRRLNPWRGRLGFVSALGTDAVTKSTFLSSRHQLPFTCCWTRFVCCGVRPSLSQMHQENHSAWETPSSHSRAPDTQKSTEKQSTEKKSVSASEHQSVLVQVTGRGFIQTPDLLLIHDSILHIPQKQREQGEDRKPFLQFCN